MAEFVENIRPEILRKCRKQMGFEVADIVKKVASIGKIEEGAKKPTFRQLDILADMYNVPRWVFISDELPREYAFKSIPVFRKFPKDRAAISQLPEERREEIRKAYIKVRGLIARVERFREAIIDLQEDTGESIAGFDAPKFVQNSSLEEFAKKIRAWLGVELEEKLDYTQWKEKFERKKIFVFMTGKYRGWSHVDKDAFRGLAIYHPILPIIIINDSDAKKAQKFTLFHELAHLIGRENAVDDWREQSGEKEKWCDKLSAEVLMPSATFLSQVGDINDLEAVKRLASYFKVSDYSCLVRLRHINKISSAVYFRFYEKLEEEYSAIRNKLKDSSGGPARDRAKEVLDQYGRIYIDAFFQAYYDNEITAYKLCKAFDLKHMRYLQKLEAQL